MASSEIDFLASQSDNGEKRIRPLTSPAQEQYEDRVAHHNKRIKEAWSKVRVELDSVPECESLEQLKSMQRTICLKYGEYRMASKDFSEYLDRMRTEDSLQALDSQNEIDKGYDDIVNAILTQIDMKIHNLQIETQSTRSSSKSRSSTSSLAAKARAKAMAAKARMALIEKENRLKKRQIDIESDLKALKEEEIYDEARAEIEVYETISEWNASQQGDGGHSRDPTGVKETYRAPVLSGPIQNPRERTSEYVTSLPDPQRIQTCIMRKNTALSPEAPVFNARNSFTDITSDLSKFLLRKDLLFSRLTKFDDKPENYSIWKETFQSIAQELCVGVREQLDLMVKWLGPDSVRYAVSLRSSSASNPENGVRRLWERLDERYGSPEMVEAALKKKIENFPKLGIRDSKKLYDLVDILDEIQSNMEDPKYKDLLSYFNTSLGVIPIVNKLPHNVHDRWTTRASRYKKDHCVSFPPFSFFIDFIREISRIKNDPGFMYDTSKPTRNEKVPSVVNQPQSRRSMSAMKTEIAPSPVAGAMHNHQQPSFIKHSGVGSKGSNTDEKGAISCLFHNVYGHTLNTCRSFRAKPVSVRKKFIKEKNTCFKCCEKSDHRANACLKEVICDVCSGQHATALHITTDPALSSNGGERPKATNTNEGHLSKKPVDISAACAQICGQMKSGKSCAKVVCVHVYSKEEPGLKVKMYALIDDQSNRSLVTPEFFDKFEGHFDEITYSLSTCTGIIEATGRRAEGFIVEGLEGGFHQLPALTECAKIPNIREEIPTPAIAWEYPHLRDIAEFIPDIDDHAPILLLIGRDIPEVHHIQDQRLGPRGSPYAQKLNLGWVIVGERCLGKVHTPTTVTANKIFVHQGERPSLFPPCESQFYLKDHPKSVNRCSQDIFLCTPEDDKIGMSVEDRQFLEIMEGNFVKCPKGNWSAPLPFRSPRPQLPNNRAQALKRAYNLRSSLKKCSEKQRHFVEFMKRIFDNGHAEIAPPLNSGEECWYLPIFGVYHSKKRDQIRVVFDSSAQYQGHSLNSVLLQGPDLNNSLLGVLMRFRREPVAVIADIQQMFFQFRVHENDRNFLRFWWFKENDPNLDLIEYRMCAHVFGNSPSPSIATFGLRKTVTNLGPVQDQDVKEFVDQNFYVDDGLASFPDADRAISVVKRTQGALLSGGNLRLHKIASNNECVMKAFPKEDLAKDLKDIAIGEEMLPTQRSLGLHWNLNNDCFTYTISKEKKPLTPRGVLSTINSLFDPLGFIAPTVVNGRVLARDLMQGIFDWDQPLSASDTTAWNEWRDTLEFLEQLYIPRTYLPVSFSSPENKEIHVFADASERAIAAVAYMRTVDGDGVPQVGFMIGRSKVAPKSGHTIPRLELCAALLAVEIGETICEQLRIPVSQMKFYTDSRVVLGYLNNTVRRFYIYVQNRVSRILKCTTRDQWHHVGTGDNPADQGTRLMSTHSLCDSKWLNGPDFLRSTESETRKVNYELQCPDEDKEIRPTIQCLKTVSDHGRKLGMERFNNVNDWKLLVKVIALLINKARWLKVKDSAPASNTTNNVEVRKEAKRLIIKEVQQESFSRELECLATDHPLPSNSAILQLSPFLDDDGLLRVGGRLRNTDELSMKEKHPLILPKGHFISRLVAMFYHEKVIHQGLHLTEGAIRSGGFWIVGGKRLVRSIIGNCIKCRKLRGKTGTQMMSDLPKDRITPGAPFLSVGVDVFGPWNVSTRRTRGGVSHNKRWAVLYTCLTTHAIHIEVIEELSTSSFVNATLRFISIRGHVREFRSDRGTNFVGATDCMKVNAINVEDGPVKTFMDDNETVWIFNSPHSSHMGGVWERLIGVVRRILDSMLAELSRNLTHEVLTTFMAEICYIVNARPLVQVSVDPDNPEILSPMMLLTQKPVEEGQYLSEVSVKDMYKAQWRRVQCLSNMFWKRWKSEYLHTLQQRRNGYLRKGIRKWGMWSSWQRRILQGTSGQWVSSPSYSRVRTVIPGKSQ